MLVWREWPYCLLLWIISGIRRLIPHQPVQHLLCRDTAPALPCQRVYISVIVVRAVEVTDLQELCKVRKKKRGKLFSSFFSSVICFFRPSPSSSLLLTAVRQQNEQPSGFTSLNELELCVTVQRLTASRWCLLSFCNLLYTGLKPLMVAEDYQALRASFRTFFPHHMFGYVLMFICVGLRQQQALCLLLIVLQVNVCLCSCWTNIQLFTIPPCVFFLRLSTISSQPARMSFCLSQTN